MEYAGILTFISCSTKYTADAVVQEQHNEINCYFNIRYVYAPDTCWRIPNIPIFDIFHQLSLHKPDHSNIIFRGDACINDVLEVTLKRNIKLESSIQLNQRDPEARRYRYINIYTLYVGWQD